MVGDIPLHKLPPQSIESEQSVLGSILIDNDVIHKVVEILSPQDFYKETHQKIYEAMLSLYERGEPLDLITLSDELKRNKVLDKVGGVAYLVQLTEAVPTSANVLNYARIVKEKSLLRNLISAATEIISQCYREEEEIEDLLDRAEQLIFSISEFRIKPSFYPIKDVLKETFKIIERLYERKELVTGVPSGFKDLDRLTSGFQPSDLIIVAGRPSMGKTAFCLNIAQYAAIHARVPTAIFSMEMSKEQVAMRMLCSEAKVNASKVRSGFLSEAELQRLTLAASILSDSPLVIDDTPALSVLELRAKARRLKREMALGLVIIDYLQLMRGRSSTERREQEISEISRSLKALAKELQIPVIAISQLSRRAEDRPGRRPQLADLRESGAIEQDADLILFIYRDEVYNPNSPKKGIAEIIIGKQRNGPTGTVELAYIPELTAFKDLWKGEGE